MNFEHAEQLSKKVNFIARIVVVIVAIILFIVLSFSNIFDIFSAKREGKAQEYAEEFLANGDSDYTDFCLLMTEFVSAVENGREPSLECQQQIIVKGYNVARDLDKFDGAVREEMETTLDDFFRGYVGFEEMNMSFLKPDENGKYARELSTSEHYDMWTVLDNKVEEMLK